MKCIHCNSEWKTDEKIASSLTSCPFCGESLAKKEEPPKIGSIIPFGNYKWRVLDVQDGNALIITEDVIEERPYNEENEGVTWRTCDLRKYLNNEFLRKFTKEQQGRIVEKRIPNPDNLWYGTKGGRDTRDKVFLLSLEEVDKYFGNSGDYLNKRRKRMEQQNNNRTLIADNEGQYFSNNHDKDRVAGYRSGCADMWWLRSPGCISCFAANVFYDGSVSVTGGDVEDRDDDRFVVGRTAVRPALWLKV